VVVYVCEYCILREEIVRERRGSYNGCVVGCIPSFCWIIKRKDLEISLVERSPHWVNHIYLCLYCIVYWNYRWR
jgi:hypothetical protein